MNKHELHILIGCADARDLNQLQLDAFRETSQKFQQAGTDIEMHVQRVAGSFVTRDVFLDIKRIIENAQRAHSGRYSENHYFIHIQTHGHLDEHSDTSYTSHIYRMNIVNGSPLNCGMLGATGVGVELEQLLIEEKLTTEVRGKQIVVDSPAKIRELLREVYAHDGYLAGDWIKSIDYLRTHPRAQKALLEKHLSRDPDLCRLDVQVTAGILDYSIHGLIRLDGGQPQVPFWDQAQLLNRQKALESKEMVASQAEKQNPLAGLICLADPKQSSRMIAARYYCKIKGKESQGMYMPNTLFNMTGSSFDIPESPFGPYVIGGFYYAVKYLGLTDQMVMGYDASQTARILQKIENDPIMQLIVKKFEVNLIPVNQVEALELLQEF
jgi:hypothetical protein